MKLGIYADVRAAAAGKPIPRSGDLTLAVMDAHREKMRVLGIEPDQAIIYGRLTDSETGEPISTSAVLARTGTPVPLRRRSAEAARVVHSQSTHKEWEYDRDALKAAADEWVSANLPGVDVRYDWGCGADGVSWTHVISACWSEPDASLVCPLCVLGIPDIHAATAQARAMRGR